MKTDPPLQDALEQLPDWVHVDHGGFRVEPKPGLRDVLAWALVVAVGFVAGFTATTGWFMFLLMTPWVLVTLFVLPGMTHTVFGRRSIRVTPHDVCLEVRTGPWVHSSVSFEPGEARVTRFVSDGDEGDIASRLQLSTPTETHTLHLPQRASADHDAVVQELDAVVLLLRQAMSSETDEDEEESECTMHARLAGVRNRGVPS